MSKGRSCVGNSGAVGLSGKRDYFGLDNLGRVSRDLVEDRLRGHGALGQLGKVATFQVFGDPVVKSPERAALEFFVTRVAKLLHRLVNGASRKRTHLRKVNNQVGSAFLGKLRLLVGGDSLAHVEPVRGNSTNRRRQNRVQVPKDVHGMTTSELHIRREAKIVANQHLVADANGSRKGLVVCVPKTKHKLTVITLKVISCEREPAKVTLTASGDCVFFFSNHKASLTNCVTGAISEKGVRDWSVCVRRIWCWNFFQLLGRDLVFC